VAQVAGEVVVVPLEPRRRRVQQAMDREDRVRVRDRVGHGIERVLRWMLRERAQSIAESRMQHVERRLRSSVARSDWIDAAAARRTTVRGARTDARSSGWAARNVSISRLVTPHG
jgi:hypothetical protein